MGLRLHETDNLWADVIGDSMEAFLSIRTHFAARPSPRPSGALPGGERGHLRQVRPPHGHGHNYLLDVTVRGPIDPRTGMVCDLAALQALVQDLVVEPFDHTFLNKDVAHFAGCVPTAENIALHIVDLLAAPIAATGARLHRCAFRRAPTTPPRCSPKPPSWGCCPPPWRCSPPPEGRRHGGGHGVAPAGAAGAGGEPRWPPGPPQGGAAQIGGPGDRRALEEASPGPMAA